VFSTVHSALVYVMQVLWRPLSNLYDKYQCRMYSGKHLMMGGGTAWNKNKFGKLVRLLILLKINLLRCTVTWT
jgi:hypothetical protein